MLKIFKTIPIALSLFALGACAMSMPDMVTTNGVTDTAPGTKPVYAKASMEQILGIGLDKSAGSVDRTDIRKSLSDQCRGGRLVGLSMNTSVENYLIFQRITIHEHGTCVMK